MSNDFRKHKPSFLHEKFDKSISEQMMGKARDFPLSDKEEAERYKNLYEDADKRAMEWFDKHSELTTENKEKDKEILQWKDNILTMGTLCANNTEENQELKSQVEGLRKDLKTYEKWSPTHTIEKIKGTEVILQELKKNQSVCAGGEDWHFKLTKSNP